MVEPLEQPVRLLRRNPHSTHAVRKTEYSPIDSMARSIPSPREGVTTSQFRKPPEDIKDRTPFAEHEYVMCPGSNHAIAHDRTLINETTT
jgi:hypothetical protein